ncbi:MAG: hypothetical protein J7513_15260 [Solirubrobacteraceae bacterium]|nr:hypothetical protein [Solirubrobacteraceae bacterium]
MSWLSLRPERLRRAPLAAAALPVVAAALLASTGVAPAGTTPTTTTAQGTTPTTPAATTPGNSVVVSASITYTDGIKSKSAVWKNIRLTITRNGAALLNGELLPEEARDSVFSGPKLQAVDLDGDSESEVIVDVFKAGVDCCRRSVVYHRDGDAYRAQVIDWGDAGYRLEDVTGGGAPEFVTSDARVPGAYDSDARGPLRVLALRKGQVRDVSRHQPRELARDARGHRRALERLRRRKSQSDARPHLVAYVADLVRLGDVSGARAAIRSSARRGELRTTPAKFRRLLDRQFLTWGYTSRRHVLGG